MTVGFLILAPSQNLQSLASCVKPTSCPAGEDFSTGDLNGRHKPSAIVLEPAKDLAEQTHNAFVDFARFLRNPQLRCELLIGGTNPKDATRTLADGVDIITGTPGLLFGRDTAEVSYGAWQPLAGLAP